jgi:hypothetical protein
MPLCAYGIKVGQMILAGLRFLVREYSNGCLKKRSFFRILSVFCFLAMPLSLFAEEDLFFFTPVSVIGSGGGHTAAEDGVYSLLSNPALLNAVNQSLFFAASGGIRDVYHDGAIETSMPPAYYTMTGPLALGMVSKGVGIGIFNYLDFYDDGWKANFIASFGIDWTIIDGADAKLDVGLAPKLSLRRTETSDSSRVFLAASVTPGIRYSRGERFSMGISCIDAVSAGLLVTLNGTQIVPTARSLNAGIAIGVISNATLGLTLFADYYDVLGIIGGDAGTPLEGLGGGIRAEIRNYFWLSAGISKLFPTAGFGLNLGALKFDVAVFAYGVEAGIRIVRD